MATVVIDAGHGGTNPGAVYKGRQEKDDVLRLALEVGQILEDNGVNVIYTRTEDITQTPMEKVRIANQSGADFFISLHRNSSPQPNQYSGVESLVYRDAGRPAEMAENINRELELVGFKNLGVQERRGLIVLRRTRMPAVLVEVGFINSDVDNALFDEKFNEIAQAIANGIMQTLGVRAREDMEMEETEPDQMEEEETIYRVQTGAFRRPENAEAMHFRLQQQGFPSFIAEDDGLYRVQVGAFHRLENAIRMEAILRRYGYPTYVTRD